jgi:TPR repeat protein
MIRFRLLALALAGLAAATPPAAASTAMPDRWAAEPPRVRSLLERAWAAETGKGSERNEPLAVALYCEAARYGSAEAHYRNGLLRAEGGRSVRDAAWPSHFSPSPTSSATPRPVRRWPAMGWAMFPSRCRPA